MLRCGALLITLLAGALALAEDPRASRSLPTEEKLKELLESALEKHKLPAMGAAVLSSKGMERAVVIGVRKQGSKELATLNDRFHLGSDTKPMTAFLIARLVEQGKLRYDLPLEKGFPELAKTMHKDYRSVTLGQLLTHRAGFPHDIVEGWTKIPLTLTLRQQRSRAAKLALERAPEKEPGSQFHYSNIGYVLAASLAERATNSTWEDLMKKLVFEPLKISTAGYGAMGKPGKIEQPWQHEEDGTPLKPGIEADNPPVMRPAGGVHCSLPDVGKFLADELQGMRGTGGLLKGESYTELMRSPYPGTFLTLGGWAGSAKGPGGKPELGHDGSNTLNFIKVFVYPGLDRAYIVATNQGGKRAQKGCEEVIRQLILMNR